MDRGVTTLHKYDYDIAHVQAKHLLLIAGQPT
jgi:hypothetical protein